MVPPHTQGLTEEAAVKAHGDVDIYTTSFRPMRNTISGSPLRAFMKLVVEAAGQRVVGVHMVGDHAAEIMQVGAGSWEGGWELGGGASGWEGGQSPGGGGWGVSFAGDYYSQTCRVVPRAPPPPAMPPPVTPPPPTPTRHGLCPTPCCTAPRCAVPCCACRALLWPSRWA